MPSSGPSANKIQSGAKETYAPYTLINVNPNVVSALDQNLDQQLAVTLGNSRKRSSALIGVGDTVAISIWEASPDGLFSSGAGRGGGTQIPEQPVSEAGTISVPYAGVIQAANRTPDQVKEAVEKALIRMAVQPQVLVSVVKNVSNTVTVTGEVASKRPHSSIPTRREIAGCHRHSGRAAYGIPSAFRADHARPADGNHTDGTSDFRPDREHLCPVGRCRGADPPAPELYRVWGLPTANASVQFDESQLYLNQALAKVGGLNDERANAKGVFIYRTESTKLLRRLMPEKDFSSYGPTANVIYQVDLTDPSGFLPVERVLRCAIAT